MLEVVPGCFYPIDVTVLKGKRCQMNEIRLMIVIHVSGALCAVQSLRVRNGLLYGT